MDFPFQKDIKQIGMSRLFLIFFFFSCISYADGQIGHGGRPLMKYGESKTYDASPKQKISFTAPPASLKRGKIRVKEHAMPLRFAHPNFVELTPENSGKTEVLKDGRLLWQLKLSSPGAYSLNLVFDKFHLSEGDSLFIYNPDGSFVIGALTRENNKSWGGLATAPIPGDEIVVEWRGSNIGPQGTELLIGAVNHDYLNIFRHLTPKAGDFGDSGSCHPDLTCFDDENYLQNGKSVCRIIVNGTELCSGTLINNSRQDGTPFIITAAHCLGKEIFPESVVFLFNYEVPSCQSMIEGSSAHSISGAELRAFADELDFALLEMSEYPPDYFRPYYSGWNLSGSHSGDVHSIHHPQGDVKKVAVSDGPPEPASFNASSDLGNSFESDAHWRIAEWKEGTTEGGSSGAGLFLAKGPFIGFLSGGSATCSNPVNDYFVRLNKIWNAREADSARVDVWLNPENDGRNSLEGYDPTEGTMLRFSHFPDNETPDLKSFDLESGYWSGPNSRQISAVSERFNEFSSARIYGVYLVPGRNKVEGDGKINVKIWSGIDYPLFLAAEKRDVFISGSTDKEVLVMLDEPVSVSGPFFVGYSVDYTAPVDSFAVYQASVGERENTFLVKDPVDGWQDYSSISGNESSMIWVDVLIGDIVYTDSSSIEKPSANIVLTPNPADNYVNLYYGEKAQTSGKVNLYNSSGKLVQEEYVVIYNHHARIDFVKRIPPGVYLLQLDIDGRSVVRKFMVR